MYSGYIKTILSQVETWQDKLLELLKYRLSYRKKQLWKKKQQIKNIYVYANFYVILRQRTVNNLLCENIRLVYWLVGFENKNQNKIIP